MSNIHNKLPNEFVQKVKDVIAAKKTLVGELKYITKEGKVRWYQNRIMPIYDEEYFPLGEVLVRYDITEKKNFEKLSITDSLTELYNRRYFNDILTREIYRATREKSTLSFIILDIDYFKKYNDTYGHYAGDKALTIVASTIKNSLHRGGDFAFRLGGEEFGIIFSGLNKEQSLEFAEQIKANIEDLNIPHSNSAVSSHITISLGLVVIDFVNEYVDENGFYTMADSALYRAKETGRNKVIMHENEELDFF
ncbi:diguanylate cyclase [Sulfuricurvum kujiense DSM 16994]|uniref:diguanylate cyclase n=1 Tax=Sulfuricurvum kujiense (strain ATCC BAA-921 / DSM 16994 / JCM 11577 / YK-1) TaxID=709032 RepID=E4TY67_SULKY|nr:diguanylate cyclase [Sulfuricurvum kujiense]ADR33987.1 diguanylate cyclase [Sulfuricurvum kujiense DSM 16994]